MNIILWAPYGAGTHYWGPGTSAYRLYKNLDDKNVKVTLIHASELQDNFPEVFVEQIKISSLNKYGKIGNFIFLAKSLNWIRKNHHKYDAFHGITAFYYTFLPAIYFNKFNKNTFIKITGGNGGFGNNSLISRVFGFSKLRLYFSNSISGYISISTFITSNLESVGIIREKIFEIPNGVDTNRFKKISNSTKKKYRKSHGVPEKFTFAYVGGLTDNKRIYNIIYATKILMDRGLDDFQFLIVGPDRSRGVIKSQIKNLIQELDLNNKIIQVDHTNNPEIYFQMSDVFILISEMEGMSNSLLEAMSTSLPAIVTKISGSEDLVEEGLNGLFTNGTPEDVADCMEAYILRNIDSEEQGNYSRNKIIKDYSSNVILDKHIRLFRNEN